MIMPTKGHSLQVCISIPVYMEHLVGAIEGYNFIMVGAIEGYEFIPQWWVL